jgi:hypothetical protein
MRFPLIPRQPQLMKVLTRYEQYTPIFIFSLSTLQNNMTNITVVDIPVNVSVKRVPSLCFESMHHDSHIVKSSLLTFAFFFRRQLLLVLDNQLLAQTDQSYSRTQELFNLMETPVNSLQMSMNPVQHSIPSLHSLHVSKSVLTRLPRWKLQRVLMNV